MTYAPDLRAEQFQFACRVMFGQFCSKWFKLVSPNPPNSQTLNQKESCCYGVQHFWIDNYFGLGFDNAFLAEGHTEAAM